MEGEIFASPRIWSKKCVESLILEANNNVYLFPGKLPHRISIVKNSFFVSCTSMKIIPPAWREDHEGQPQLHPNTSGGRTIPKTCHQNTSSGRGEDQENLKEDHQNIISGRDDRPGQHPCRQNTISGRGGRPGQHPCHQNTISGQEDRPDQHPCRQNIS